MLEFKTMLLTAAGSALLAVPALAQGRPLPPQPPPARAQQGTAGPAIPPAPPAATITPRAGYPNAYGQPVIYSAIPVTVASDGRVYANFGFGYTLVPQQCSAQRLRQLGVRPAAVEGGSGVRRTASQTTSASSAANGASASQQESGPCWTRARNGAVVVYR